MALDDRQRHLTQDAVAVQDLGRGGHGKGRQAKNDPVQIFALDATKLVGGGGRAFRQAQGKVALAPAYAQRQADKRLDENALGGPGDGLVRQGEPSALAAKVQRLRLGAGTGERP